MALEALDHRSHSAVVGGHYRLHLFWVEPGGKLGRADQITEQHGQLAAFGCEGPRRGWDPACGSPRRATLEQGNGVEQLPPMPDRADAKRDQVLGGQPRQHLGVDIVGAKCLGVILQAQLPQLARDVHLRRPA
jgi:hypothetical protein